MALARLRDIALSVKGINGRTRQLVGGLTVDVDVGEVIAVMGPNGSGKTSLLRVFLGQRRPDRGDCKVDFGSGGAGYMPQDFRKALFPWLSVRKNSCLYENAGTLFDGERFRQICSSVQLALSPAARVGHLSGGEQQLLLMSLALSRSPTFLCLDEPFAAIDLRRRPLARSILALRVKELHATTILVTHDPHDAAELATSAIVLRGDGQATCVKGRSHGQFEGELVEALHS